MGYFPPLARMKCCGAMGHGKGSIWITRPRCSDGYVIGQKEPGLVQERTKTLLEPWCMLARQQFLASQLCEPAIVGTLHACNFCSIGTVGTLGSVWLALLFPHFARATSPNRNAEL